MVSQLPVGGAGARERPLRHVPAKMSAMMRPSAFRRCWSRTGLLMPTLSASFSEETRRGYS